MTEEIKTITAMWIGFGTCLYVLTMMLCERYFSRTFKHRIVYHNFRHKYYIQARILDFHLPIPTLKWEYFSQYYAHIDLSLPCEYDTLDEAEADLSALIASESDKTPKWKVVEKS